MYIQQIPKKQHVICFDECVYGWLAYVVPYYYKQYSYKVLYRVGDIRGNVVYCGQLSARA